MTGIEKKEENEYQEYCSLKSNDNDNQEKNG
jgi:hypothetical protein